MNVLTRLLIATVVVTLSAQVGRAAPQGGTPRVRQAASPGSPAAHHSDLAPPTRIAVLDFAAFPARVAHLKRAYDSRDRQLAGQTKELRSLQDRLAELEAGMKLYGSLEAFERLAGQWEATKKELERKKDARDQAERRAFETTIGPVQNRLNAAIAAFARRRGIVLVVNVAQARQSGSLFYVSPATDVTDAFIDEFNKSNP
jgi:Skp family chaperone for outer membrane proteins